MPERRGRGARSPFSSCYCGTRESGTYLYGPSPSPRRARALVHVGPRVLLAGRVRLVPQLRRLAVPHQADARVDGLGGTARRHHLPAGPPPRRLRPGPERRTHGGPAPVRRVRKRPRLRQVPARRAPGMFVTCRPAPRARTSTPLPLA